MPNNYESPTIEPLGGDSPMTTIGLGFYFVFVFAAAVIYVAAVFSVATATTVSSTWAGIDWPWDI